MTIIFITGMSGTGKSSALEMLALKGYCVVDTDSDRFSKWVTLADGSSDWVWDEEAIGQLLASYQQEKLYISGCKSNQGKFYGYFNHIVLLSAPMDIIVDRIAQRTNNDYGKTPEELEKILLHLREIEPLLRATATIEIDASAPLHIVVDQLEALA